MVDTGHKFVSMQHSTASRRCLKKTGLVIADRPELIDINGSDDPDDQADGRVIFSLPKNF